MPDETVIQSETVRAPVTESQLAEMLRVRTAKLWFARMLTAVFPCDGWAKETSASGPLGTAP